MQIGHSVHQALNSASALKQAVGLAMFNQVKEASTQQAHTLLQDFAQVQQAVSQHPHLGKNLDVRV